MAILMKLQLKRKVDFPKEHLLYNINPELAYEVKEAWTNHKMIIDDSDKEVWLSGAVLKQYFKEV